MSPENMDESPKSRELNDDEEEWLQKNFPGNNPRARQWLERNAEGLRTMNGEDWMNNERHSTNIRRAINAHIK